MNNTPSRWFISFASSNLPRHASRRIKKQAQKMGGYDHIIVYDEHDLDPDFCARFAEHLVLGSKGFGYWCWKPQIIAQTMALAQPGDIIQYTDVGCHLNPNGRARLDEYFALCAQSPSGVLGFQARAPEPPLE